MKLSLNPCFATATLALGRLYLAALSIAGFSASPRACDLAVVFGNTVDVNGQPSPRLRARLGEALARYEAGTVRRLMVSGGILPAGGGRAAVLCDQKPRSRRGRVASSNADAATMKAIKNGAARISPKYSQP